MGQWRNRTQDTPYLWWKCAETSGTTIASSGSEGSSDLTTSGSTIGVGKEGVWDYGLVWTDTTTRSFASGAATKNPTNNAMTLSFWAYMMDQSATIQHAVRKQYATGAWSSPYVSISIAWNWPTASRINGMIAGAGTNRPVACDIRDIPRLYAWAHYALTYDGSTITLLINGNAATASYSGTIDYGTNGPWSAGANDASSGNAECWKGGICDIRVYNAVKTAAWCRNEYKLGLGRF